MALTDEQFQRILSGETDLWTESVVDSYRGMVPAGLSGAEQSDWVANHFSTRFDRTRFDPEPEPREAPDRAHQQQLISTLSQGSQVAPAYTPPKPAPPQDGQWASDYRSFLNDWTGNDGTLSAADQKKADEYHQQLIGEGRGHELNELMALESFAKMRSEPARFAQEDQARQARLKQQTQTLQDTFAQESQARLERDRSQQQQQRARFAAEAEASRGEWEAKLQSLLRPQRVRPKLQSLLRPQGVRR